MIAMALLTNPDLIIADEPTTALDVTIQAQILKLLRSLAKDRGVSVLLTTHDLGTAYEICDDITVMYAGQEVETAPVAEFFANPRHPYTARLLESLPDPAREMQEIGGEIPSLLSPPTRLSLPSPLPERERAMRGGSAPGLGRASDGALLSSAAAAAGGALMSAQAPLLQVSELQRHFPVRNVLGLRTGTIKALDDVSFDVRPGETFGIVGESGCGKTTLGKTLAGIHKPSAGRILFEAADISGLQGAARGPVVQRLQYIHQDPGSALDPRWTIGRSLDEPLATHTDVEPGRARRRGAGRSWPPSACRRSHLDLYPHELSGGQQRRVGLARILTLKPRLVILDEPTSGLDVSVQATVLKLLRKLQRAFDLTYIFISHDLSVVRIMCDRVAVMYLGRIVEIAPAAGLFAAPRHPYTRSLLSAIPRIGGKRVTDTFVLEGEPPDAGNLPSGCRFRAALSTCRAGVRGARAATRPGRRKSCDGMPFPGRCSEGPEHEQFSPCARARHRCCRRHRPRDLA